jgi:hypothetical protein
VVLATLNATTGKATVAADLDTTKYAGATDIIAAYNAQLTATTNVGKAHTVTVAAQAEVDHLDVDNTINYGTTGKTEAGLLTDVTTQINAYATAHADQLDKVATGSTATEAQITTALAVMQAHDDATSTTYETFNALVTDYRAAAAATNPLVKVQSDETTLVKNATTAITDLNKLVAEMNTAQKNLATMKGLEATLEATSDLLEAKGYHVNDTTIGTAASDIFTVDADTTISLFNLQGTDSVFVGSGYKLVQGSIDDVKGDNAALEVFLSTNASGDAVLEIETSAFGSSAATPEVITITLTGVDATTLHLNNGIISAGTIA